MCFLEREIERERETGTSVRRKGAVLIPTRTHVCIVYRTRKKVSKGGCFAISSLVYEGILRKPSATSKGRKTLGRTRFQYRAVNTTTSCVTLTRDILKMLIFNHKKDVKMKIY